MTMQNAVPDYRRDVKAWDQLDVPGQHAAVAESGAKVAAQRAADVAKGDRMAWGETQPRQTFDSPTFDMAARREQRSPQDIPTKELLSMVQSPFLPTNLPMERFLALLAEAKNRVSPTPWSISKLNPEEQMRWFSQYAGKEATAPKGVPFISEEPQTAADIYRGSSPSVRKGVFGVSRPSGMGGLQNRPLEGSDAEGGDILSMIRSLFGPPQRGGGQPSLNVDAIRSLFDNMLGSKSSSAAKTIWR
jgi:hypothetical protein